MRKLAINYLEKRGFGDGFEKLRERLIWSYVIRKKTFMIKILTSTTEKLEVSNILGSSFCVSQSDKEVNHLFAGELGKNTNQITLKNMVN
ncbi:MAG: hypothetical protein HEQ10_21965 [Dolichospermum sp. DEX182a]|nr:hypothetical protein [Dolichospermum sp. DEX182a]